MAETPAPSPMSTAPPWDLVADAYTARSMATLTAFAATALGLASVSTAGEVADVACGPGTLSLLAAPAVRHVAALDVSPRMVASLEKLAQERGLTNVTAVVGDGQALPWADGRFEAAFSLFGLMFFPDRATAFGELLRVLAPGGRAVVSSWPPMREAEPFATVVEALGEVLPDLPLGRGPTPLGDAESFAAEMNGAGFTGVEVRSVGHVTDFPTTAAFWTHLEETMVPLMLARKRQGEAAWATVSRALREALEARLGAGAQRLELRAWMGIGLA